MATITQVRKCAPGNPISPSFAPAPDALGFPLLVTHTLPHLYLPTPPAVRPDFFYNSALIFLLHALRVAELVGPEADLQSPEDVELPDA